MKRILLIIYILNCFLNPSDAQQQKKSKLVVGIVVDQMREEFLYRFYDQYGENGFKRLMRDGFNCRNVHVNYIPTITGPGHSSIYTGTTPEFHGIVANNWYDRSLKKQIYCVDDTTKQLVGSDSKLNGVSPSKLLSTTITDELKISTNGKAKVIGISMKDRAAIYPAGHMADGAYWFDLSSGNFISSTFYMKQLPGWVKHFNKERKADRYLSKWEPLLPDSSYSSSTADDEDYEVPFKGMKKSVFPYDLKMLSPLNPPVYTVLYESPFANSLLTDFAAEAIVQEKLGANTVTDFLAISYSSTDAVGHKFGPLSRELNDTYLRLDLDISRLLDTLDKYVGAGNYTLFLTADHGDVDPAKYLMEHQTPAGFLNENLLISEASEYLNQKYGTGQWVEYFINDQFYLNRKLIEEKKLNLANVQLQLAIFLDSHIGIARVITASQLNKNNDCQKTARQVQSGFYFKRSGDVIVITEPGWTTDTGDASTHGTGYTYDTHIPLIWYGAGINKGESIEYYNITDIAPTISQILKIKFPSAATGNPLVKVIAP